MDKTVVKTLLISNVTELIASKYKITLDEAHDAFYESETLKTLEDEESGLYGCSALYIFSLFLKEKGKLL